MHSSSWTCPNYDVQADLMYIVCMRGRRSQRCGKKGGTRKYVTRQSTPRVKRKAARSSSAVKTKRPTPQRRKSIRAVHSPSTCGAYGAELHGVGMTPSTAWRFDLRKKKQKSKTSPIKTKKSRKVKTSPIARSDGMTAAQLRSEDLCCGHTHGPSSKEMAEVQRRLRRKAEETAAAARKAEAAAREAEAAAMEANPRLYAPGSLWWQ